MKWIQVGIVFDNSNQKLLVEEYVIFIYCLLYEIGRIVAKGKETNKML